MGSDFSVLIPARGTCEFLKKTLESICTSSILPHEVVIVDDGIEESVVDVISLFGSELNIFILKNPGSGIVSALNTGLTQCKTTFIARLDADDMVTSDRFERQLTFMRANQHVAVLGGQVDFIDSKGEITGRSNYEVGRLDNKDAFGKMCMLAHPAAMIRTSMALAVSGYRTVCRNERTDFAEDFDFWLRISRIGQVHNLNEVVLYYRQHGSQVSQIHSQMQEFATAYISMVNSAEVNVNGYVYRVLFPKKYSFDFFQKLISSIPKSKKVDKKIVLIFEGLLIFFEVKNSYVLGIFRKLKNLFH
jgi:glycosyltransferase involved in cell wall biosynthesis